ncbi:MAG: hypothetical protein VX642_10445 [Bdellovibrionota bacterium]|nr:hypothetical protein [Bdellovibrionota bacterium]
MNKLKIGNIGFLKIPLTNILFACSTAKIARKKNESSMPAIEPRAENSNTPIKNQLRTSNVFLIHIS